MKMKKKQSDYFLQAGSYNPGKEVYVPQNHLIDNFYRQVSK
jgi:hypothetical protein